MVVAVSGGSCALGQWQELVDLSHGAIEKHGSAIGNGCGVGQLTAHNRMSGRIIGRNGVEVACRGQLDAILGGNRYS